MREGDVMQGSLNELARSQGEALRIAEGLEYVPAGGVEGILPGPLDQLRITLGSKSFRFRGAEDGEGLIVDGGDLTPREMGEHGAMRRVDLSEAPTFKAAMNTEFCGFSEILAPDHIVIGVVLGFAAGYVVVCNWGDELRVLSKIPLELFLAENITVSPYRGP